MIFFDDVSKKSFGVEFAILLFLQFLRFLFPSKFNRPKDYYHSLPFNAKDGTLKILRRNPENLMVFG